MAVDAVTAEVMTALDDAGVESILLKGPSIAAWLYDDPTERVYVDTDLLVDPAIVATAHTTLERLGFHRRFGPLPHPGMEDVPSYAWQRSTAVVDLHETLPGATAGRRRVWQVLRAGCAHQVVAGRPALVLNEPARLAHVAVHAAQHGSDAEGPLADLDQALARLEDESWRAASELARDIGALVSFTAGLRMRPAGTALLARLGLHPRPAKPAMDDVPLAGGINRLRSARGVAARIAVLRAELFPSPIFMRWWTPLARRSRGGLAAAYVWRWIHLAWHTPHAIAVTRRKTMKTSAKTRERR